MLVIRMQRTGRSGHAQFRVIIQDSRRTPTSGNIVAQVGSYNPHTKQTTLVKEKVQFYLDHGAQPSPRVARLLKAEGVKLPAWVKIETGAKREVRNADKRRSTRPPEAEPSTSEEAAAEAPAEAPTEEPVAEETAETVAETSEAEASEAAAEPETPAEPEAAAEETAEVSAEEAPEAATEEQPVADEASDNKEAVE